ncbi:MAG: sodium:proton antiporter [Betaproteobacteria bacterium HGW-Betaproteobacteria-20]|nr:MAG: sodium:proton antiporter [Betaproteobacteria bacterium HGW-Betaproteobacteria-20]
MNVTSQLIYLTVIFTLLVIPRALQRFRIPAPLTCFALGISISIVGVEYANDPTLALLATLGISSLFLFAGLEVNIHDLRKGIWLLLGHLFVRCIILAACVWIGTSYFEFSWQVAALLALAALTPSTGFILESLPNMGLNEDEKFWVTNKAIAGELLALLLLFLVLKSDSYESLAVSSAMLFMLAFGLPFLLMLLGRTVIPHAPGSEFSLLVMVGLIAAYVTKELGVYYLVGAFLAGFAARQLREKMPTLASDENLHAVKLFASFFVPFYFFYSGMKVPEGALLWQSLWLGLIITAVVLPLRVLSIILQRLVVHKDAWKSSLSISLALAPTLIFTLVLATILHERYDISDTLFGGLLVYAALTTMLPALVLNKSVSLDVDR